MAEPKFKAPKGVTLELKAEPSGLFDEAAPAVEERPAKEPNWADGWIDLREPDKDFPFTGAPVLLTQDKLIGVPGVWRATRVFSSGKWVDSAFWVKRNAGGARLGFTPVAYRKIVE